MNDLRFALRQLAKWPGSTVVILTTLALVIGTLSLALGVLQYERSAWRPFPEPDQLVRFWQFGKDTPREDFPATVYAAAAAHLKDAKVVAGLGPYESRILNGAGETRSLSVQYVTASVAQVVSIEPLLGRWFSRQEQGAGREDLLVISANLWQSAFGGDRSVIGKVVRLNDVPCAIIGVMPPGFEHSALFYGLDAWLPRDFSSPSQNREWLQIVARRKPEAPVSKLSAAAQAILSPTLASFAAAQHWDFKGAVVRALPLDERPQRSDAAAVISVAAIALFVVTIAIFNITGILLGRVLNRRHEFAVRFSLGAGRGRIIRQLLTESLLLAFFGTGLGIVGAVWIARWALTYGVQARFTPSVLAWTMAAATVIGLAVVGLPAWRATRGDLYGDLKEASGSASPGGSARQRLRPALVVGQVALATALCLAGGLLVHSYLNKRQFNPGFDPRRLISIDAALNQDKFRKPEQRLLYAGQALQRLRALPGVEQVAFSSDRAVDRLPFPISFRLEGQPALPREQMVNLTIVSPNYLPLVGLPVLRGRGLSDADRRGVPPVVLVNQAFADRYFPGTDPLGKRLGVSLEGNPDWLTIVGIVADRRNLGFQEDLGPEAYLCAHQFAPTWASLLFLARTRLEPLRLREALREAVRSVDPNVAVGIPVTVRAQLQSAMRRNLGGTRAVAAIGLFGLLMAVVGVYGVVAYAVVNRTRELGIRLALGATRRATLALIVRQGLRWVCLGLVLGLALGLATTLGLRGLLYGVHALDPTTYLAVALAMFVSSLVATLVPARRVLRINPVEALRYE